MEAELARSIMMALISNASMDQIQTTNKKNGGRVHLIQAAKVTNSKVRAFDMESAHASKLVRQFLVMDRSLLENGMI